MLSGMLLCVILCPYFASSICIILGSGKIPSDLYNAPTSSERVLLQISHKQSSCILVSSLMDFLLAIGPQTDKP